jgi:hypothetical protein
VVGRRGENFGVEKRWKKYIYVGREDGIFVHPENGLNGLIRNWCIGGCCFTLAQDEAIQTVLGMNQKHILFPYLMIFQPPSLPQNFPLLPTSPPPTSLTSFPAHSISKARESF